MAVPPYDNVETVLNMARVRLNDAIGQGLAGETLTDSQPFTIQVVNNAWRRLQSSLARLGFTRLVRSTVFIGCPSQVSADAANLVQFNWLGYFDGALFQAAPVLPQDFIVPLSIQERISGTTMPFYSMDGPPVIKYPLPMAGPQVFNRIWTWFNETIWMPGTVGHQDLQVQYAAFLPDFVPASTTAFTAQTVPIVRSADALAWFVASEVAKARGGDAGDKMQSAGEEAALTLAARENPSLLVPKETA